MGTRRIIGRPGFVALAAVLVVAPGAGHADILPSYTNTGAAVAVSCGPVTGQEGDLSFGTISIASGNAAGTVQVSATASPVATANGAGITVSGNYRPALCTVTDVNTTTAAVTLSGGGGTFSGDTLSGATLKLEGSPGVTLPVSLTLSATSVSQSPESGLGAPVYIGGTLSIESSTSLRGLFSETFTITVTEN